MYVGTDSRALPQANRASTGAAPAADAPPRPQLQQDQFSIPVPGSGGVLAPIQLREQGNRPGGSLVPSVEEQAALKRLVEQPAPQFSVDASGAATANGNHEEHIASGK